jgi:hypothetical protein
VTIDDIAAKMNPHTPWTVWNSLATAAQVEAATLDAMNGHLEHTVFAPFYDGFRLERGKVKVIVNRGLHHIQWSRLTEFDASTHPEKTAGMLEMFGDSYALHGRAFRTVKDAALFLLDKLT